MSKHVLILLENSDLLKHKAMKYLIELPDGSNEVVDQSLLAKIENYTIIKEIER